jgi:hypothetical protein
VFRTARKKQFPIINVLDILVQFSVGGPIANTSDPSGRLSASEYRREMRHRFESVGEITGTQRGA